MFGSSQESETDAPAQTHERILPTNNLGADVESRPGRKPPATWAKSLVQYPAILDLG